MRFTLNRAPLNILACFALAASSLPATEPAAALTAADVLGPDGIVYPDWRHAGIAGGIPRVPNGTTLADFGGKPDDDTDDSNALQKAAVDVGAARSCSARVCIIWTVLW